MELMITSAASDGLIEKIVSPDRISNEYCHTGDSYFGKIRCFYEVNGSTCSPTIPINDAITSAQDD